MEIFEIGEVKTTTRIRNGVEQVIRLFNNKQRKMIIEAVESKQDGMTIEDVLKLYDVSPVVYYSWLRKEPERKPQSEDKLPNPLEDMLIKDNVFTSISQLRAFYEVKSQDFKAFIQKQFEEWLKTDLISQIDKKITPQNISEVAKAGNISVDELKSFLQRENKNLSYYSVESIKKFLQI